MPEGVAFYFYILIIGQRRFRRIWKSTLGLEFLTFGLVNTSRGIHTETFVYVWRHKIIILTSVHLSQMAPFWSSGGTGMCQFSLEAFVILTTLFVHRHNYTQQQPEGKSMKNAKKNKFLTIDLRFFSHFVKSGHESGTDTEVVFVFCSSSDFFLAPKQHKISPLLLFSSSYWAAGLSSLGEPSRD